MYSGCANSWLTWFILYIMAQAFKQSSNFNFVVEATPSYMQLANGQFVKDGFTVNRRTDNFAVLGKVTDRYGLVQHSDLIEEAERAFQAQGMMDYTRKVIVAGNGERMYAVYDFRSVTKAIRVGDEVGLRLTVQNSFDGSLRASFLCGLLRLVCSNGLVTVEKEVGVTQKHGSKISTVFVSAALTKALASWQNSTVVFERLAAVSVNRLQGANILNRLAEGNVLSGKLLENILPIWASPSYPQDEERSLYSLYNAVTQHLTRGVTQDRYELAERVSRNVLSILDKAGKSPDRLERLLAPIAIPV